MSERNFPLGGFLLFAALALATVAVVKSEVVEELWGAIDGLRARAIHEVRAVGKDDVRLIAQQEDAVNRRLAELKDGDAAARRYAAWALGELESQRAVGPLIESLDDSDAAVRLVAAWALGEIKDQEAIEPLIATLGDSDPLVREMAVLSLGEIEDASAVDAIVDVVERHADLREPAIWALGEIGGRRADAARDELFADLGRRGWENDEVWAGRLETREARSMAGDVSALSAALDDDDPRLRASAAEYLGRADDERAVEALLDALRDPEPAVRAMAIWALDETNPSRKHKSHTHSDHGSEHEYEYHEHRHAV